MVTLALASNHATRDLITVADVTNIGDFIVGTAGFGQLFRPYALSDATNYANILGNVDTTNGRALQVQYGDPTGTPTVLLDIAKAATKLNAPLTLKQTTAADPGATYTALYAKSDSLLYYFPTGGAETRIAKYTDTPASTLTTAGDLLYRDGSGPQRLAVGTAFQELTVNSGATAPQWSSGVLARVTTAGDIVQATGANAIARLAIGTARQTLLVNAGATALAYGESLQSLMTAAGDVVYASSANTPARLAKGADGTVLTLASGIPAWSAAATSGLVQISKQTLGSDTTSINFTSISGSYSALMIDFTCRGALAAATDSILMRVGAAGSIDTGANYDWEELFGSGGSAGAAESFAASSWQVGAMPANTATANEAGTITITLTNYAATVFNKKFHAEGHFKYGTSTGNQQTIVHGGSWRNTAAIDTISLLNAAGFKTGSVATLWGKL